MKFLVCFGLALFLTSAQAQLVPTGPKINRPGVPSRESSWYRTGIRLMKQGQFKEANQQLAIACQLKPENESWQLTYGECYVLQGDYKRGLSILESFDRAQELQNPRITALIALCYSMTGRVKESREMVTPPVLEYWFGKVKDRHSDLPNRQTPGGLRATWIAALVRDVDTLYGDNAALRYCELGLQQVPKNPILNVKLGTIHLRNKRFVEAQGCFEKALANAVGGYAGIAKANLTETRRHIPHSSEIGKQPGD